MAVQEKWVPSTCKMCLHGCGIRVKVRDGVVVKIEGDPTNQNNLGKLCPKGNSGIMRLYDPQRVKSPLRRTNPVKGSGVDPGWEPISWDEALTTVADKLGRIRREDPRKLLCAFGDFQRPWLKGWPSAFGAHSYFTCVSQYCGAAYHPFCGIVDGSFAATNDFEHCNYWIQFGSGAGFSSHLHLTGSNKRMADARRRGMKLVVVEPRLSEGGSKANEWIPIRPGTDRAFALGMMNVLLHELDLYDAEFIKKQTNGPYLIGEDGYTVRGAEGKAMVWDPADACAKPHDDPGIKDFTLKGRYTFEGRPCAPGFQLLCDAVAGYTPEKMSGVTTVPAETIRRIAREYGEAARIGSTIRIGGRDYPYRPAAVNSYRGAISHKDGGVDTLTFKLINIIMGNIDVPGGHMGVPLNHTGFWIEPGEDGMLKPQPHMLHPAFPPVFPTNTAHLLELFPIGIDPGHLNLVTLLEPERFRLPFYPEALLIYHANPIWNMPATRKVEEIMGRMKFIVAIDILLNESTEWADIVLPDHSYLETYGMVCLEPPVVTGHTVRQPVVEPLYDTKDATEILNELAERMGFLDTWNDFISFKLNLVKDPSMMLEPGRKYGVDELMDRFARLVYGKERGLDWFREHGHAVRKRTPAETYRPYGSLRIPLYFEYLKKEGDALREKLAEWGLEWDTANYTPLPFWKDTILHRESSEYDLYAITFKWPWLNYGETMTVSWIKDLVEHKAVPNAVYMHPGTAGARGIADGDVIVITSPEDSIRGVACLTEGMHPETIAVPNTSRWINHPLFNGSNGIQPAHFNRLLSPGLEYTDTLSGAFETCARVKVTRG